MAQYKCIKRVTLDNGVTVHEVGDVLDLTEEQAQSLTRQGAVQPFHPPEQLQQAATPVAQPVAPVQPQASADLDALKKADADIQAQIASMEHEGGVAQ